MKNLKRALCLVLSLVMVFSFTMIDKVFVGAYADSFDQSLVNQYDDIKGHWASDGLTALIGYGYMNGVGGNKAAPNEKLTTAQMVALLVRIMGGSEEADLSRFVDMDPEKWYYSEVAQAQYMGILPTTGTNYINPEQAATREYAAYILCRAFGLVTREPIDSFSDAENVSSWAVSSMQAMYAADALVGANGKLGNKLNPGEVITRGEFAEMVYRLVGEYVQPSDSTKVRKQDFDNGLLISRRGVTLSDCVIDGNLYISDAVNGDVTLDNTVVTGNIYVRGANNDVLSLEGDTVVNTVVFINPHEATGLVVADGVVITGVLVNNGADEVTLEGNVGNVTINTSDVDLIFEDALAAQVIVNAADANVEVDAGSTIQTLNIAASSDNVTVKSKGTINRLAQMANNVKLEMSGSLDYLLIGAVSGLKMSIDNGIKLGALDLHCSDSEITVDSVVGSVSVSSFVKNLQLNIGKNAEILNIGVGSTSTNLTVHADAKVGTATIDAPLFKANMGLTLKNLVIGSGATGAEITLVKGCDIETITINGSNAILTTDTGAEVGTVNVIGKNATVTGKETVHTVNVGADADGTKVTTPNTAVANAGAEKVTAGGVEVPVYKTYKTVASGKDVVRNTDGTPDGDGDTKTGADKEVASVANFDLSFAANATESDIFAGGTYKLSDLVSDIALVKTSGGTYKLTGNVKYVDKFAPLFDAVAGYGTGYYVPVVLSSEFMDGNWTLTTGGYVYDKNDLSKGTVYRDKLVFFLQLATGTLDKTVFVSFDRDGAGTEYTPVTVAVDYSAVTFDGHNDLTGETISYPVRAEKRDLTTNGAFDLDEFGTFNVTKLTGNVYTVTGMAYAVAGEVKGNTGVVGAGNKHYVPLMVNTTGFKAGWTIVLDDGTRFTASSVSSGNGCRGNLVLLLAMTDDGDMVRTLYFDTDADGRVDADGVYTLNMVGLELKDTSTPDDEEEEDEDPTTDTELKIKLPTKATAEDLTETGELEYADFGDLDLTVSNSGYYSIEGTIEWVGAIDGNITSESDGGYYVPVRINTSILDRGWVIKTTDAGEFTYADRVKTGEYKGDIILLIDVDHMSSSKAFSIMVDEDGDGEVDTTLKIYNDAKLGPSGDEGGTQATVLAWDVPNTIPKEYLTDGGELTYADIADITISYDSATSTTIKGKLFQQKGIEGNLSSENVDGYYVPMMITTSALGKNWTVTLANGVRFNYNDTIPAGDHKGDLIVLFNYKDLGTAAFKVYVDKDNDGNNDKTMYIYLYSGSNPALISNAITTVELSLSFAAVVDKAYLTEAGDKSFADFGNISFGPYLTDYYKVTGELNYLSEIEGNLSSEGGRHYVPLLVNTSKLGDAAWRVSTSDGAEFTKSDSIASGDNNGDLVILMNADALAGSTRYISIFVDKDGDGANDQTFRVYNDATLKKAAPVVEDPIVMASLSDSTHLTDNGNIPYGYFGNMSIEGNYNGNSKYFCVTGTAKRLSGVRGNIAATYDAGYYVPVLIYTKQYGDNWKVFVDNAEFTKADAISSGDYAGQLVVLMDPTVMTPDGSASVTIDTDGDGSPDIFYRVFGDVTRAWDSSKVTIPSGMTFRLEGGTGGIRYNVFIDGGYDYFSELGGTPNIMVANGVEIITEYMKTQGYYYVSAKVYENDVDNGVVIVYKDSSGSNFSVKWVPAGTLEEPADHQHSYTYTSNNDGTHNGACICGEGAITNEACSYVSGACSKCGATETVTPPAHEHSYSYTSNGNGTHNGACTCGEDAITNEACSYVGGECSKCGAIDPATPVEPEQIIVACFVGYVDDPLYCYMKPGDTVADLMDEFAGEELGNYYAKNGSSDCLPLSNAASDVLAHGDIIVFGLYKVTLPKGAVKAAGVDIVALPTIEDQSYAGNDGANDGGTATAHSDTEDYFVMAGTELTIVFGMGTYDPIHDTIATATPTGDFVAKLKLTGATLSLAKAPLDYTLELKGTQAFDTDSRAGIQSIELTAEDTLTITGVSGGEIIPTAFAVKYTVTTDVVLDLIVE